MKKHCTFPQRTAGRFILAILFAAMTMSMVHARNELVSLINLIATPERYHGKEVVISAYVTIEMGNMSLCQVERPLTKKDCLWLTIYSGPFKTAKDMERYNAEEKKWLPYHGRSVSLRGTFDKNETGHHGLWSGGIKKVTAISDSE